MASATGVRGNTQLNSNVEYEWYSRSTGFSPKIQVPSQLHETATLLMWRASDSSFAKHGTLQNGCITHTGRMTIFTSSKPRFDVVSPKLT